ncbi:MAG: uroporphyrinogen decarboxylase family protein [Thermodesulfobacteriota bacterium]
MTRDYQASWARTLATLTGLKPDRVPLIYLASEDVAARITGLTIREMMASPEILAEKTIMVNDFLGGDGMALVANPYCGPFEGLAYAKVNDVNLNNVFVWKDYTTPFIREGIICKSEKDIENLKIPDHHTVEPWPTFFKAIALVQERTGLGREQFAPSLTWSSVQMLRGSQAYLDVKQNPDLLMMLCEKIYSSQWNYYEAFRNIVGQPVVAFQCSYAFNQHMLSFEDAWKFEGQFIARFAKKSKVPLIIHNCGFKPYHIELVERLETEGATIAAVNASHPLNIDWWVNFRERFPHITVMGGLHVNSEMESGTAQDVENRVKEFIQKVGGDGRLIITPVCCMPWRVPLSNIRAVTEAVKKWGAYPIHTNPKWQRFNVINKCKHTLYKIRQNVINSIFSRVHDDYRLQLTNFMLKFRKS